MSSSNAPPTSPCHARASTPPPALATGITIYGCEQDEAALFRDAAPRFGVEATLTELTVSEDTIELAVGKRCISIDHKRHVNNATLLALSQAGVEYVSTRSIGYNHLDLNYAHTVGLSVENVAYSPDGVADYTLMLMLMTLRQAKSVLRRTDAHDYRLSHTRGKELRDLTVGVIGMGRIGRAVIDRLKGFGCRVLTNHKHLKGSADHLSLSELLQHSDIITLHTPLTAETHHLLNHERIGQMKHGAFIINTGRGPLIDTDALLAALESGTLGGAALDVLEGEEGIFYTDCRHRTIENSALLRLQHLPNVLISPHMAYYTDHALQDIVENSLINCMSFENGKRQWAS